MSYAFRNITVLVVESNKPMFDLTKGVLLNFGVNQIYSAFEHDQAYEVFNSVSPDLLIIDWLDNPKNGLELTKKIRRDPDSANPFVPIILTTGYSQKKRVEEARDSGITEFLVKPFMAKALYQRIEQLIERPRNFVRCDNYFGPDRRRKRNAVYEGPERRSSPPSPSEIAENIFRSRS